MVDEVVRLVVANRNRSLLFLVWTIKHDHIDF